MTTGAASLVAVLLCAAWVATCRAQATGPTQNLNEIEKLISAKKVKEAREKVEQLPSSDRESAAGRFAEAQVLFRELRFVDSVKILETLLLGDKGKRRADGGADHMLRETYKLLAMNYILLDKLNLAEPVLETVTARWPDDHLPYFHLGMLYYTTSRFAAAEKTLRQAIKLSPQFMKAHESLGLALEELNQEEAAVRAYRRALDLAEQAGIKDSSPYLNLSKLLQRKNNFQESLPLLEKALRFNPRSSEAAYFYGKALYKLGREAEAVAALAEAARHDSTFAEPHYLLSRIYLNMGRAKEAEAHLRTFQKLKDAQPRQKQAP